MDVKKTLGEMTLEEKAKMCSAALASSFDRKLMEEVGQMLREICQAEGVGILLGPGVNIKCSPLCGRNFEYYSEDPYVTGELASAYIKAYKDRVSVAA